MNKQNRQLLHSTARQQLLSRLVDKYEGSQSFGQPGPWPRDVLLRLDETTFPDAWKPGRAEDMQALLAAASDLCREGLVRIEMRRGRPANTPAALRVGPDEVMRLLEEAEALGLPTLRSALDELKRHAEQFALGENLPAATRAFMKQVATDAYAGRCDRLVGDRRAFSRLGQAWLDALSAAAGIAAGVTGYERVVSERVFGDSKRLSAIEGKVLHLLRQAVGPADAASLDEFGVQRTPRYLGLAGSAVVNIGGVLHPLADHEPHAFIPESWALQLREAIYEAGIRCVTTVENYTPYLAYVEEAGGAAGLGRMGEVAIYTAGPLPLFWLHELAAWAQACPEMEFRHWPDLDGGGMRIWWSLRRNIGQPVMLFRVNAPVRSASDGALASLGRDALAGLNSLEREIAASPVADEPDVSHALEVIARIRQSGVRTEQESMVGR